MTAPAQDPMVSTSWLSERLDEPDVVVIDATWYLPGDPRNARAEHAARHIPGAVFFDIDVISDHATHLPHMLPAPTAFAVHARRLGVAPESRVVVYDAQGIFSAPRVWWSFRAMGHDRIWVLDGGLPKWLAESRPIEAGWPVREHTHFKAHLDADLVRDLDQVRAALDQGSEQVVDARSAARFTGEAPEPRPGLRGGHMPGAHNLPSSAVVNPDGTLAGADTLRQLFAKAGVDVDKPIVTTCGSGVSAAVMALALARMSHWRTAVYDGSWSEWGGRSDTAVVKGAQ